MACVQILALSLSSWVTLSKFLSLSVSVSLFEKWDDESSAQTHRVVVEINKLAQCWMPSGYANLHCYSPCFSDFVKLIQSILHTLSRESFQKHKSNPVTFLPKTLD